MAPVNLSRPGIIKNIRPGIISAFFTWPLYSWPIPGTKNDIINAAAGFRFWGVVAVNSVSIRLKNSIFLIPLLHGRFYSAGYF